MYTRTLSLIFALLISPLFVFGQQVRSDMLVGTDWLASHMPAVALVEVGDRETFNRGHIPSARLLEYREIVVTRNGVPNELPAVADLERVFGALGIDRRTRVVLYSRDPLLAARAWFTLDYLGHDRKALLDGGYGKWVADGRRVSQDAVPVVGRAFVARVRPGTLVRLPEVRTLVRWRDALHSEIALIDARPAAQFCGYEAGPDVERAGRIPGSVNVAWDENLTRGAVPAFLPPDALGDLYRRAGVTRDAPVIVYCRTGTQAALSYFVLRYLGYDVSLYDGSYIEWARDFDTTVVDRLEWCADVVC